IREARPVSGHAVLTLNRAYGDHLFVGSLIAHHAHGLDRQKDCERLPEFTVEAGPLNLFTNYVVSVLKKFDPVMINRTDDSDCQPGTREWLAVDQPIRQP